MLEEGVGDHCHERMTMKAGPRSSLEVIEAEFLFQLLMGLLADLDEDIIPAHRSISTGPPVIPSTAKDLMPRTSAKYQRAAIYRCDNATFCWPSGVFQVNCT